MEKIVEFSNCRRAARFRFKVALFATAADYDAIRAALNGIADRGVDPASAGRFCEVDILWKLGIDPFLISRREKTPATLK